MSAWTQLYNLGRSIIKRPAVWLSGIIVAGLTGATTDRVTDFFKSAETAISEKAAELSCRYRQKPIANDSQFTILVSPLAHDPDRSYTEKVQRAFLSEEGILAVPICQSLSFDFSPGKDNHATKNEIKQRGMDLLKANHADLLLFGEASKEDKAILIYTMNEHGGCDDPKPTKIELSLPDDFTFEEKEKLVAVSLQEIQSVCSISPSMDWLLFAKRMNKMEMFLKYLDFNQENYLKLAGSYINATSILYEQGQNDVWFSKGEMFAKSMLDKYDRKKESMKYV